MTINVTEKRRISARVASEYYVNECWGCPDQDGPRAFAAYTARPMSMRDLEALYAREEISGGYLEALEFAWGKGHPAA